MEYGGSEFVYPGLEHTGREISIAYGDDTGSSTAGSYGGLEMKSRYNRMVGIGLALAGVALAATFLLRAMNENVLYFFSPTQVMAGEPPEGRRFRVGGLVIPGTIERETGSLEVRFVLTDNENTMPIVYSGILPDLFREGQGIIAHGELTESGSFVADEVLAKHDENYMPPEVAESLKQVHGEGS
jgi:cytochrome c-type biogenesis protein CcmE